MALAVAQLLEESDNWKFESMGCYRIVHEGTGIAVWVANQAFGVVVHLPAKYEFTKEEKHWLWPKCLAVEQELRLALNLPLTPEETIWRKLRSSDNPSVKDLAEVSSFVDGDFEYIKANMWNTELGASSMNTKSKVINTW